MLGALFPQLADILNPGGSVTTLIVVALFLIAGYTMPSEQIVRGLTNARLHIYIQTFVFIVVPAYFYLTAQLFSGYLDGYLVYGFYALGVLPTTISSCVVFTQNTNGNAVGALFNAALANTVGVLISPLLLSLFLAGSRAAIPAEELLNILRSLLYTMLIPIGVGQILRRIAGAPAKHLRKILSTTSSALILLIVLLTVSRTSGQEEFLARISGIALPLVFLAFSHILLVVAAYGGARLLGLSHEDQVAAVFAAPQKTMALGVPLLSVYFASRPDILALALLPLLFYHPFQLFVAGLIRTWFLSRELAA